MIEYIKFENIRKLGINTDSSNKALKNNKLILKDINIICGQNGAGKSTIIDCLRCLKQTEIIASIPRENMDKNSKGVLQVKFKSGDFIKIEFTSRGMGEYLLCVNNILRCEAKLGKKLDLKKERNLQGILENIFIAYRESIQKNIDYSEFAKKIKEYSIHFIGLNGTKLSESYSEFIEINEHDLTRKSEGEFIYRDDGFFEMSIDDDDMRNIIHIDMFPSGWKNFLDIIIWLEKQKNNTICLLEEPETHLHPRLQRLLIKEINRIQKEKNLQIVIASHSSVFIDPVAWDGCEVSLFYADGYGITDQMKHSDLFYDLGIRPADIFQANGVIWVEGPSDRVYIKKWLDVYAKKYGKNILMENIHYTFILYGGTLMKYYSLDKDCEKIDLAKVNNNYVFIMDKDLGGESYKENIKKDDGVNKIITDRYTIENYLPDSFFSKYFKNRISKKDPSKKITEKISSKTKVEIANEFFNERSSFTLRKKSKLEGFIEKIYNHIESWNI